MKKQRFVSTRIGACVGVSVSLAGGVIFLLYIDVLGVLLMLLGLLIIVGVIIRYNDMLRKEIQETFEKERGTQAIVENAGFIPGPVENVEQIAVPVDSTFDLPTFQSAAQVHYKKYNVKRMAKAAFDMAEIISKNFDTQDIRCMVPASRIDPNAPHGTLPIHFLFMKNGQPKVAVVIVTKWGHEHPYVLATKDVCDKNHVAYLKLFANGVNSDWRSNPDSPEFEIVRKIKEALL